MAENGALPISSSSNLKDVFTVLSVEAWKCLSIAGGQDYLLAADTLVEGKEVLADKKAGVLIVKGCFVC